MVSDIKALRISNRQLLISFLFIYLSRLIQNGFEDSIISILFMAAPFIALFPAFLLGKLGAADVKLLMIIVYGVECYRICDVLIFTFLFGILTILIFRIIGKRIVPFSISIFLGIVTVYITEIYQF